MDAKRSCCKQTCAMPDLFASLIVSDQSLSGTQLYSYIAQAVCSGLSQGTSLQKSAVHVVFCPVHMQWLLMHASIGRHSRTVKCT